MYSILTSNTDIKHTDIQLQCLTTERACLLLVMTEAKDILHTFPFTSSYLSNALLSIPIFNFVADLSKKEGKKWIKKGKTPEGKEYEDEELCLFLVVTVGNCLHPLAVYFEGKDSSQLLMTTIITAHHESGRFVNKVFTH